MTTFPATAFTLSAVSSAPTIIQAPISLATPGYGAGQGNYPSYTAHMTGFLNAMNQRPLGAVNISQPGSGNGAAPNTWPSQVTAAIGGRPANVPAATPVLWPINTWTGSASLWPSLATNAVFAGQTCQTWLNQSLAAFKAAGITKVYTRLGWEFNGNFQNNGISGLSNFITGWQNFYTWAHTFAAANGMTVRICWNPTVNGTDQAVDQVSGTHYSTAQVFPNQNTGDRFVDVVMADAYSFGQAFPNDVASGPNVITCKTMIALCQKWGCTFGTAELGGTTDVNGNPASATWIPQFIALMQTLQTLTPAVPIEILSLWDWPTIEWSGNGTAGSPNDNQPAVRALWQNALGTGGTNPIMTTSVISSG